MNFKPSTISKINLDGRDFYVKRDDLIDLYLSGNKYRKLHTLLQTPKQNLKKIISYGGSQSNAMLAIARMCELKSWEFIYYTKPLSNKQKEENLGNFHLAKKLNMKHIEINQEQYRSFIASLDFNKEQDSFLIHQGGAIKEARDGLEVLAQEILNANIAVKSLATPSGTGTTALFLALALPTFKIYTTPCVGNVEYLKQQMLALCDIQIT